MTYSASKGFLHAAAYTGGVFPRSVFVKMIGFSYSAFRLFISFAPFVLMALVTPASAESRLAFVVGINAYANLGPDAQLRRAVNDADAVGDTLQSLGFKVTRVTQGATLDSILKQFDGFTATIAPGDTVVLFYAGHGISLDDGTYLLPADVPALGPNDALRARRASIAEKDLTQQIRTAGAKVAMAIIDACRDNPFSRQGTRSIGLTERGLGRLAPQHGIYTLYSASEGQTALDRLSEADSDPNSVFTRIFVGELKKPNINLVDLGENVRDEVSNLAHTVSHEQIPAVYNDIVGARQIYLSKLEATPPADRPTSIPTPTLETTPARKVPDPAAKPATMVSPAHIKLPAVEHHKEAIARHAAGPSRITQVTIRHPHPTGGCVKVGSNTFC